ncbi:hypothetical protein GIB67_006832 [Kingdonia uniflora]|uniref:Aminotransferase-like plant mobile domain-containing protein n=1 Tax=Kingdonia uniflora TaxID=39325 RepID=A0A7J7KZY3_9MAGN|nr:hypothetical protein GIB67_006832 [Kingdonia uniflora]
MRVFNNLATNSSTLVEKIVNIAKDKISSGDNTTEDNTENRRFKEMWNNDPNGLLLLTFLITEEGDPIKACVGYTKRKPVTVMKLHNIDEGLKIAIEENQKNVIVHSDSIAGISSIVKSEKVFENNLLQDLNVFKSLKAGGVGNSLSLRKLKEHYAYKLEKVLSDSTTVVVKKMKGLTVRSVARTYMSYVLGSFLFPMKKGTDVSARYLYLFAKDKVAKKWSWGSTVLAHMYYNLGAPSRDDGRQFVCCTTLLEVVWDPYRDKRDSAHAFKEVTLFYGALASPDHVQPCYPNRVVRQFNRE